MRRARNRKPERRKLSKFERETERRRAEMLRTLAGRTMTISNKRLKSLLWRDASKPLLAAMRAKPRRSAP